MLRLLVYLCLIVLPLRPGICRNLNGGRWPCPVTLSLAVETDTVRISELLERGNYFVYKSGSHGTDIDSAKSYYLSAIQLSESTRQTPWFNRCTLQLGDFYFIGGHIGQGKKCYQKIFSYLEARNDVGAQAVIWCRMAKKMPDEPNEALLEKVSALIQARKFFEKIGDSLHSVEVLKKIAEMHIKEYKVDQAKKELTEVLRLYKLHQYKNIFEVYNSFAELSKAQIDLHKELFYRIEVVKNIEASGNNKQADYFYQKLATVYTDLKMYKQSLFWSLKAIQLLKKRKQFDDYYGYLSLIVYDYICDERPEEALSYLIDGSREVPPLYKSHTVDLEEGFGNCYVALKKYGTAERHYLKMMELYRENLTYIIPYASKEEMLLDYIHYFQTMGNFYLLTRKFVKAGYYFTQILELPPGRVRAITLSKVHMAQFRVDSAADNYISAINHFERHKGLDDSLFNIAKSKQIEELQFRYETEKKDKELQLREKNILMLENRGQIQQLSLKRAETTRNLIVFSAIIMLAFSYLGFGIKQKHNTRLQLQQAEINDQNQKLKKILTWQEKLVVEKEWLVKEIHHRVKNNLQIVISLLNTQSKYLDNKEAKDAIGESRHRVQAMSLIHNKLYQSQDSTSVNMPIYIGELISYLEASFKTEKTVFFEVNVDAVDLDISQAIPIGLILNEAITNAIKYAFTGCLQGNVSVNMQNRLGQDILLSISDNGNGFSPDYDFDHATSMGLRLIRGLVKQIGGKLKIENTNGVSLSLTFRSESGLNRLSPERTVENRADGI